MDDEAEEVDDAGEVGDTAPVDAPRGGPRVDVSRALHTAGHEVEDLGFEGVEDSAPLIHDSQEDDQVDFEHRVESDIATRGQGHV